MSYFEDNQNSLIFGDRKKRELRKDIGPLDTYIPHDERLERLSQKGIYMSRSGKTEHISKMSRERLQNLIDILENVVSNNGGVRKHYYLDLLRKELCNRLKNN